MHLANWEYMKRPRENIPREGEVVGIGDIKEGKMDIIDYVEMDI